MKYNPQFIQEVDTYIESAKKNNQSPTVKGFAESIGTDENSIWAWATKHTKDANGVVTDQLARPEFFNAVQKIKKFEDDKKREEKADELNAKQEMFCQLYATDREFFGNGTQTYIEVYEIDKSKPNWYKTAQAAASRLLSNVIVVKRINELLEDGGLNEQNVDKQLQFLVNQYADFGAKLGAIREFNKLKARITEKLDHTTNGKDLPTPIYNGRAAE